jgi:hypothetical protein
MKCWQDLPLPFSFRFYGPNAVISSHIQVAMVKWYELCAQA